MGDLKEVMRLEGGDQREEKQDRSLVSLQGLDPEGLVVWGRKF